MRKKITIILCVILTLALCVGVFVGCEPDAPPTPDPTPTPTPDPTPDPKPDPGDPIPVEFFFKAVKFEGVPYNGEVGSNTDKYVAALKATVSVSEGTARAVVSIKSLKINGVLATAEELGKMKILNNTIPNVTTTEKAVVLRVEFGDFSDPKYYGVIFSIELEANPSAIEG